MKEHDLDTFETFEADLLDNKAMSSADDMTIDPSLGMWGQEIAAALDLMTLKSFMYNDQWVYITVNFVARKLANQMLSVYKKSLRKGKVVNTQWPFHSLNDLIENPNNWEGYTNFIYRVAAELTLMGNCIIWKLKFHNQLLILPTELVHIETNTDGTIKHYSIMQGGVANDQPFNRSAMDILPEDIIHLRLPNPSSMLWGLSPFIPGRKSVLFDRYSQEYLLNFYQRQANPGPIMEIGTEANEKNAIRLLKSLEQSWSGRNNQRRTMILPKGVTAKALAHTLAEQELKEHLEDNRDTIKALLSIPPHAFGTQKTGSIGSNETKEQMKAFWENTGKPFGWLIADGFSLAYRNELGKRYFFSFDYENIAALREDEREKAETANLMLSTHTLNEVRSKVYDMEPLDGGDKLPGEVQQLPFGNSTFSQMSTEPTETFEISKQSSKLRAFLKRHDIWFNKYKADNFEGKLQKNQLDFMEKLLALMADFAPVAVKEFKKVYGKKAIGGVVLKSVAQCKDNREDLEKSLKKAWKQFETNYKKNLEPILIDGGENGYDLALDTPFEMPNQEEQSALRQENAAGRRRILEARGLESFEHYTDTTVKDILDVIALGTEENRTLDVIARNIREMFGEVVPGRARTIARTEVLTASSLGWEAAFQDANKVLGGGVQKVWITLGDDRVRDTHSPLDGTSPNAKGKFDNGLRFPRDPAGPPHETINCRCSLLLIPPGEDLDVDSINTPDLLPGQLDTRPKQ